MMLQVPLMISWIDFSFFAYAELDRYQKFAPKLFFDLDAAHLHLLSNHLPIFVSFAGIVVLFLAILKKCLLSQQIGLLLLLIGNGGALVTYWFGKGAYKAVRGLADEVGQDWLDVHMERADQALWLYGIAFLVVICAGLWSWKKNALALRLAICAGLLSVSSLVLSGWVADAGGKIRHPEFRNAPPKSSE